MLPDLSLAHFLNASRIRFAEPSARVTLSPASSPPAVDSRLARLATRSGLLSKPMASRESVRDKEMTVGRMSSPVDALNAMLA